MTSRNLNQTNEKEAVLSVHIMKVEIGVQVIDLTSSLIRCFIRVFTSLISIQCGGRFKQLIQHFLTPNLLTGLD